MSMDDFMADVLVNRLDSTERIENNYWRWTAMNGERCPGESLPFEPSMRHADGHDCNN